MRHAVDRALAHERQVRDAALVTLALECSYLRQERDVARLMADEFAHALGVEQQRSAWLQRGLDARARYREPPPSTSCVDRVLDVLHWGRG